MKVKARDKKTLIGYTGIFYPYFFLLILTAFSSLHMSAQSGCIANIENGSTEICLGNALTKTFSNAVASGGIVDWISSGDGIFSDPTIPNPTYTPGPIDFANGYVYIYLDVYKDDSLSPCSSLPVLTLHLSSMHASATPPLQSVCSGAAIVPVVLSGSLSTVTYNWTRDNVSAIPGIAASGSGNIRGALANISSAPVTVTFTITPTSSTCLGTPVTAAVIVNPKPIAVASPASQTICSGATITPINLSSTTSGTIFNWTRNNTGTVTGIGASGTGNITGALSNTTTSAVTVTFTITPAGNSCTGTPVTATVIVNPSLNISAVPSAQTICSGSSISPITFSDGSATVYSWSRNNTGSVAGIAANGSGNVSGTLINTGNTPTTVSFSTTTSGGCPAIATVVVNPIPNAVAVPSSQAICSQAQITPVLLTGNVSGTSFNWSRDNPSSVTGVDASGSGDILCMLSNTTVSPVTITFTVMPTANGCMGAPVAATVTVNPRPTSVISGNQAICAGQALQNISIALSGTAPWTFTYFNGTTPVTVTGNIINPYTFTAPALPAIYTVTALNDASCIAQAGDMTGSATLTQSTYTITASADANGSITPGGATNINCGANQTYNVVANSGFTIQNVIVDGVSLGAISSYTFSNVSASHIISATFTSVSSGNIITASADSSGSITPAGAVPVTGGADQSFIITANSCYQIGNVIVDGVSVGAVSTYTFSKVSSPHTIIASFTPFSYALTASAGANGNISPTDKTTVNCGTKQTYTITPNSCYQIASVIVDGVSMGAVSSYTFSDIAAAHTISATFSQLGYSITATAGTNGSISPSGTTNVNCGASQTYTITPNTGFTIQSVLVDGISQGNNNTYIFSNVTASHTISATFASASGCAAPTISGAVSNVLCRNGSSGAIDITTSGGTAPFTYAWTGPNNFTAATEDISGLPSGSYRVTITATGGCSAAVTYNVAQPAGSLFTSASFGTILCNGGTTNVVMSTSGGTLPYTGSGTIANQPAGMRTYTVTDANGCTASSSVNILQPTALTITATAGAVQCGTGTATMTAVSAGGNGTKQYSLNGGAFQAGNTFTVTPAGSPYTITVKDANNCTTVSAAVTVVQPTSSSAPAQPASVSGPVYGLCGGGTFTYTVDPVAGATGYTWTSPSGCTIISGQGTNQIQLSVPATFKGPGTLGVSAINSCGTGTQLKISVFGVLYYPGSGITGPSTVTRNQANVQYSLPYTAGITYFWIVPAGSTITSGQGTNIITVTFGRTNGNLSVDVQNACGTAPRASKAITMTLSRPAAAPPADQMIPEIKTRFSVYPNPAHSFATIVFNSLKTGSEFKVMITNATGKALLIKNGTSVAGANMLQLDINKFSNGMYIVQLITEENTQIEKLFKSQ